MAGITTYETRQDCLSMSMWEENGIQYRSNLLTQVGAKVALHAHSYDHTARIRGRMRMTVNDEERQVNTGDEIFIAAWQQHSFELLEGVDGVGEVLCFWTIDHGVTAGH